jgi:hypothetical protein
MNANSNPTACQLKLPISTFFHLSPVSLTPVINLNFRISPRLLIKIQNGPHGLLRSRKSCVRLSLNDRLMPSELTHSMTDILYEKKMPYNQGVGHKTAVKCRKIDWQGDVSEDKNVCSGSISKPYGEWRMVFQMSSLLYEL